MAEAATIWDLSSRLVKAVSYFEEVGEVASFLGDFMVAHTEAEETLQEDWLHKSFCSHVLPGEGCGLHMVWLHRGIRHQFSVG